MKRLLPHLAIALLIVELLIMFVSWLLSAAFPTSELRSLLSSEGLRWFFGQFSTFLARPSLIGLLLLAMAWGCCGRVDYSTIGRLIVRVELA